jgi:ATP-dependent exoDNAse (exonuclease V) alpha subunit
MKLNEEQSVAFENIKKWVVDPLNKDRYRVLSGYAGTGKTFMLQHVTEFFRDILKKRVMISAPTNKALKVLYSKIAHEDFTTIHSFLAIRPIKSGTKLKFKPVYNEKNQISQYDIWIIDECSMVENSLMNFIETSSDKFNKDIKILFVGDPAQLPPVSDGEPSKSFSYSGDKLLNIVRYGDEIAKKAKILRNNKKNVEPTELINGSNIRFVTNLKELVPYFTEFRFNPNKARFACFTNARVLYWNYLLRNIDYGVQMKDEFSIGDVVMANDTCQSENDSIIMQNAQEGKILEIHHYQDYVELKLLLDSLREQIVFVRVVKKHHRNALEKKLKEYSDEKDWQSFWKLKNYFHDIRHCYALTTHKHQGSTYQNIFLDVNDIYSQYNVKERNQLMYVAMTRATDNVFFYDSRKIEK